MPQKTTRQSPLTHKAIFTFLLLCFTGAYTNSFGQCGDRYQNEVFSNYTKTTVTYSDTFGLKMDIYQPQGDAAQKRPLVILAFGGSFVSGGRAADPTIVSLCEDLTKRGYVTASIDYRLATSPLQMLDTTYAITTVLKAASDGKAAIRYFVKDAETTNQFKIDTSLIFVGGNSAGAVLYMHVGYLNHLNEASPFLQQIINQLGGLDGNSGNAGYTYHLAGVIDLAGGLHSTNYISSDDPSSFNVQGDQDQTVPYYCAAALSGASARLCGLGSMEPVFQAKNIDHFSHIFVGQAHVPWASSQVYFDTVENELVAYLYNKVCAERTAIISHKSPSELKTFPNPANENLIIKSTAPILSVALYNILGQRVVFQQGKSRHRMQLSIRHLISGLYALQVRSRLGETWSKVLILHQ